MPLDTSDFPYEVQVAFFIFSLLSDRWDGMSGSYLGKDWSPLDAIFKIYDVEEPKFMLYIMKLYERELVDFRAEESQKQRKAEERKAKAGGTNYTHNVKS